jgi:cytochrome c biogenesis protein CcmG, thiol:disulfide interchange protein DsbE
VKVRVRWLIPLAAIPVVGLLAYGFRTDPRAVPSPLVGRPAPAFSLTTFDGKVVSLESLRGQVVVLNFWASWCYPACYEEAPILEASWRQYQKEGVTVLGVAIQDKEPASLDFIQRFGLTFPNAPDPAGRVSIDYGVYGVPETFLIDRRGMIRRKHVGAVTEAAFREGIAPLLGESAAEGPPSEGSKRSTAVMTGSWSDGDRRLPITREPSRLASRVSHAGRESGPIAAGHA